MATLGIVENGVRRRRKTRRRRNSATTVKTTTRRKNPARRKVSLSSARAVAKRNGLKLVSKSASNPKRRKRRVHHRRRNGVVTTRRNGFFGNTKGDAKTVGTVLAGAIATKTIARILSGYLAPYIAQVGLGKYSEILVDAVTALTVTPFIAKHLVSGGDVAKNARLGGLLVVGLSAIEAVAPNVLAGYNPFVTSPVVMTGGGAAVTPQAVAQIAAGVANSANPAAAAASVGSAMLGLSAGGSQMARPSNYSSTLAPPELVL